MRRVISASRRVRKTGAVPVFGFTRAKSSGASEKAALRVVYGIGIVQEEGALGLVEAPLLAAEDEDTELEPTRERP